MTILCFREGRGGDHYDRWGFASLSQRDHLIMRGQRQEYAFAGLPAFGAVEIGPAASLIWGA